MFCVVCDSSVSDLRRFVTDHLGRSVRGRNVRIQYPCSLGSVNSDIQSSRDVLVSFRILVCVLWSEFSNRTASFSMSAGQHWSCNM